MRRAKIVCTLGPSSNTPEAIGRLIDAGLDVARLNFSHGTHDTHRVVYNMVREQAKRRGKAVAILQDLQGPKIRVGTFKDGKVELEKDQRFTITSREVVGTKEIVSTVYRALPRDVRAGDTILLDDGYLQLEVVDIQGEDVITRVVEGGTLKDKKGINLPGVKVSAPALSEKDRVDLELGKELGVDLVALSFVRTPEDVAEAKRLAGRIPVIAKIEKPEAVARLDEILDVADGIMVARGDLGVEMGPEKVPLVQKRAIEATNRHGKLIITATQMLESMIENPRPTRAEASDVANAVLDGTDALMLSGETASGKYPEQAVRTMASIIEEIEGSALFRNALQNPPLELAVTSNAVAQAAVVAARRLGIRVIACCTHSGSVARLVSEYRPEAMIYALTPSEETYRGLAPYWGVIPILVEHAGNSDEMFAKVEVTLRERRLAAPGDQVVITMGMPVGANESTNAMKVHRIH